MTFLEMMAKRFKKVLILDLDETLLHSTMFHVDRSPDFELGLAGAYLRPGVREFMAFALDWFETGIWTGATRDYTIDAVSQFVKEPDRLSFVWTREQCSTKTDPATGEEYRTKDLSRVIADGGNIESIIVVDDDPRPWEEYRDNVVLVQKYRGEPDDRELIWLLSYLERLGSVQNVRAVDKTEWRRTVTQAHEC
jgi:TFIIF-interacting CTD phosphatase-like protein